MAELIHQFGVDWRLLIAQAVNFGILFFVLYRFAYRPILGMLETRREKIREGMMMREEAEQKLKEADRDRSELLKKTEKESIELISRAESLGKKKEAEIIAEAMLKGEEVMREGKRRAEEEKRIASEEFSKEAAEVVRLAAAKVIERSPERIDEELVKEAIRELGSA